MIEYEPKPIDRLTTWFRRGILVAFRFNDGPICHNQFANRPRGH